MGNRLCIPDLHSPYQHPDTIDFLCDTYAKYKCDSITCLGDELDFHGISHYVKDPRCLNTHHELIDGAKFLNRLQSAFESRLKYFKRLYVLIGNHYDRLESAAIQVGLTPQMLKHVKHDYHLPAKWFWVQKYERDGIVFTHGTQFAGVHALTHAIHNASANVVFGHLHADAGIRYLNYDLSGETRWAMNCGCLVDPSSPAFGYAKRQKYKGVLGCGVITDGYPIFVPLR
jgi:predicted phosphodiesterase